jgi:GntR family transcriptional regulator
MSTGPLDKDLPVPLYHQLHEVLRAEIESGKWRPGGQIPTETQLVERFGVSKITVRQALQQLVDRGYIRREHGRGTFVSECKFDEGPRELTSFTEEMKRHSLVAGSHILAQSVGEAEQRVADALRVPVGSPVFLLKRARIAGGGPVTIQTAHIPASLVPGIVMTESDSLYDVLQGRYDLYPARARETYVAGVADGGVAGMLGIEAGAPIFQVERVTFLPNDKPFEFVQSIIRGDRYSIVLELVKHGAETRVLEWKESGATPGRR